MTEHERIAESELADWLANHEGWSRESGGAIGRSFRLPSFRSAIAFVNAVAEQAEAVRHHPSIRIDYRTVLLSLTTHDAGGLTRLDCRSAEAYDAIYADFAERGAD